MSKAISKPSLSEQWKARLELADSEDFQTEYRRIRSDLKLVCGDIVNLHQLWTFQDSKLRKRVVQEAVERIPEYAFQTC